MALVLHNDIDILVHRDMYTLKHICIYKILHRLVEIKMFYRMPLH